MEWQEVVSRNENKASMDDTEGIAALLPAVPFSITENNFHTKTMHQDWLITNIPR